MRRLRKTPKDTPHITGSLEGFLKLPTELVFEVLRHLHTLDLYHLSLTSQPFGRVLSGTEAIPLWKSSFARIPDFPPCPSDLTNARWASLMFGPVRCQDCGRFGAQPDIALYKNFCTPCTEKHFVSRTDVLEMFSSHPEPKRIYKILKTVCQARCRLVTLQLRTRNSGERGSEKRFLREHVELCAPFVLKELEIEDMEKDGIPVDLEEEEEDPRVWRIDRIKKIAETNEHTMKTLKWVVIVLTDLQDEHRLRAEACTKRCERAITNMNLGYTTDDIRFAAEYDWKPYFQNLGTQRMTRKDLRFHKEFLLRTVRKRAVKRLKLARTLEIMVLCDEYRATLKPLDWLHHPPATQLMEAQCFKDYINQDIDYKTQFSPDILRVQLPKVALEWEASHRTKLATQWITQRGSGMSLDEAKRNLDLARCVFLCAQCRTLRDEHRVGPALCGWDNALTHMCHTKSDRHQTLGLSKKGEEVVLKMLLYLDMDPDSTTAQRMDDLDYRFFCGGCDITTHRKDIVGRKAYTWSEYVTHVLQEENKLHLVLMSCLGPEATRFVKDHERQTYRPIYGAWGCAHCTEHLDQTVILPKAIAHAKNSHDLSDVVLHKDVLRFDNRYSLTTYKPRRPFIYSLLPLYNMMCKRCPTMAICKIWDRDSLRKHLLVEHFIAEPVDDTDWRVIEVTSVPTSS